MARSDFNGCSFNRQTRRPFAMSDLDPSVDRLEVTRTSYPPGAVLEVRRASGATARAMLWIVGIIGIATLGAVTVLLVDNNQSTASQQAAAATAAQTRAQTLTDSATAAQQSAASATQQSADQSLAQSQQALADQSARDRADSVDAAARAAKSADTADRAAATDPAASPAPQ
jgi:hypothetical protein